MLVYRIQEQFSEICREGGWALAACSGGEVVAIRRLAEVAGSAVLESAERLGPHARLAVKRWLEGDEGAAVVRELVAHGEVRPRMSAAREFVAL